MTWLEFYGFFLAPLSAVLIILGMAWLAARLKAGKRERALECRASNSICCWSRLFSWRWCSSQSGADLSAHVQAVEAASSGTYS